MPKVQRNVQQGLEMLYPRNPAAGFFFTHAGETHHDQTIADRALMSCRAVKTTDMSSALPSNRISFKTITVLNVGTENLLVRKNPNRLHVIGIKRKRPLVI